MSSSIEISINGEAAQIEKGHSVADLLAVRKQNPRFLAVEVNQELVPRTEHENHVIQAGDKIEIVTLVGGG